MSCSDVGGRERRRERAKRSAVVSVKTGWIVLRVGVGFERMGRDWAAARRRGVAALGFRGFSSGSSALKDVVNVLEERILRITQHALRLRA